MTTFHDPRLQQALEVATPHIEGFSANLDAMSEDIKTLEDYLNDKQVRVVIEHEFATYGRERHGEGVTQESEHLVFGNSGNRWRVFYKRIRMRGSYHMEMESCIQWFRADFLETRPLIEAKTEVRVRAHKALPDFLKKVARHFAIDPTELDEKPDWECDDNPF